MFSYVPVGKAFLQAAQENTRHYDWTGRITTAAGAVYGFSQKDIVKGSGYISGQCCGSPEIGLGMVYAAEMEVSFYLPVDRYMLEDAFGADIMIPAFFTANFRDKFLLLSRKCLFHNPVCIN